MKKTSELPMLRSVWMPQEGDDGGGGWSLIVDHDWTGVATNPYA